MKNRFMLLLGICFAMMLNCSVACAEYIYAYTQYQYDSWYGEMRPQYDVYLSTENTPNFLDVHQTILVVPIYVDYQPYGSAQGMSWTAVAYNWNGSRWVCQATDVDADKIWNIVLSYGFFEQAQEDAEKETQEREEKEEKARRAEAERKNKEAELYKQTQAAKPYVDQAIEFYKQGKYKEGDEAIEHAYLIAPTFEDIYWVYYHAYEPKHKWNKIEELFSRGIDKGIHSSDIIFWRGYAFYKAYLQGVNFSKLSDSDRSQLLNKAQEIQRSIASIKSTAKGNNRKYAEELYTALGEAILKLKK